MKHRWLTMIVAALSLAGVTTASAQLYYGPFDERPGYARPNECWSDLGYGRWEPCD